jgi:hypothetical protein
VSGTQTQAWSCREIAPQDKNWTWSAGRESGRSGQLREEYHILDDEFVNTPCDYGDCAIKMGLKASWVVQTTGHQRKGSCLTLSLRQSGVRHGPSRTTYRGDSVQSHCHRKMSELEGPVYDEGLHHSRKKGVRCWVTIEGRVDGTAEGCPLASKRGD